MTARPGDASSVRNATLIGFTAVMMWGALALLTVPEDVGSVYNAMIGAPAAFTFNRRLGECQAIELSL